MSCSLAINFYTENIGHSLTFETSHFLNSSIHHGELVYRRGGADLVLYLFKMPSEFKFKHQFLKLASKETPHLLGASLRTHLLFYMPETKLHLKRLVRFAGEHRALLQ